MHRARIQSALVTLSDGNARDKLIDTNLLGFDRIENLPGQRAPERVSEWKRRLLIYSQSFRPFTRYGFKIRLLDPLFLKAGSGSRSLFPAVV